MGTCENCRWWMRELPKSIQGPCMRFPPQVHPSERMGVFPVTNALWACGEWHPQPMKQEGGMSNQWISVRERLPDDGDEGPSDDCLLWQDHRDGFGSHVVGYFSGGKFWLYEGDNITSEEAGVTITHWMPLPEPPEAK